MLHHFQKVSMLARAIDNLDLLNLAADSPIRSALLDMSHVLTYNLIDRLIKKLW